MNAEWTTRPAGDGTLVELTLATDRPRRVRVEATGDGPVRPPRTDGVPDEGWDATGYSGVVDGRLALGFATPGDPGDPPVTVEWRGPPDEDPTFDTHPDVPAVERTADGVLRALTDPRPPRAAIPSDGGEKSPTVGEETSERDEDAAPPDGESSGGDPNPAPRSDGLAAGRSAADRRTGHRPTDDGAASGESPSASDAVPATDLDAMERRLALAERLAASESLAEAAEAVGVAGGLDGVRALDEAIARDRVALAALADRAAALRGRAAAVDVPTEALARVAGEEP